MHIGKIIAQYRENRGMTQRALAARLDVATTSVSAWETGVKPPGMKSRVLLAEVLDIPHTLMMPELTPDPDERPVVVKDSELKSFIRRYQKLPREEQKSLNIMLRWLEEGHGMPRIAPLRRG